MVLTNCKPEEVEAKLDDTHALNEYLEFMKDTLTASLLCLTVKEVFMLAIGDVKGLNLAWAVWPMLVLKLRLKRMMEPFLDTNS